MEPLYYPNIYALDTNVDELVETVPWLSVKTLRKECFMSPVTRTYQYDGVNGHVYESIPFTLEVQQILAHLNHTYNYALNVCFLNYYADHTNALGWHKDDSHPIDHDQPIAVVSFGAERQIWVKHESFKGEIPSNDRYTLGNGSLFIMPAGYQKEYMHKIPKHDRPCGARISLTFRRYADEQ